MPNLLFVLPSCLPHLPLIHQQTPLASAPFLPPLIFFPSAFLQQQPSPVIVAAGHHIICTRNCKTTSFLVVARPQRTLGISSVALHNPLDVFSEVVAKDMTQKQTQNGKIIERVESKAAKRKE